MSIMMKKIQYYYESKLILFPNNWIVLPPVFGEAEVCSHVGVIAIRGELYTWEIPHFIFFTPKPINKITNEEKNYVFLLCEQVYPEFDKVLEIAPLNKLPSIGFFEIIDSESYPNVTIMQEGKADR